MKITKRTELFNSMINLVLTSFLIPKGTWKREKYFYLISSLILIPFNWLRGNRRDPKQVEIQYDQISGSYISDNYYSDKKRYCILDGEVQFISTIENMKNIRKECNVVLSEIEFSSVLEVGVGELTTMESIVNANEHITKLYGIDLSVNRMCSGINEYIKRQSLIPILSKSN